MNLLFVSKTNQIDIWKKSLESKIPNLNFFTWSKDSNFQEKIDYALVWNPPPGQLHKLPGLKAILSLGAGVDGLLNDPELPNEIPIIRLVDHCLTKGMTEYVVYWTLFHHRQMAKYQQSINSQEWTQLPQADTREKKVGILGAGELGRDAAQALNFLEFDVATWSQSPKTINGVKSFYGPSGLSSVLKHSEILICLLPLTEETRGIINSKTLNQMSRGGVFINCARGAHVIDSDLLAALDSGQLKAATLDVFNDEPLEKSHPFWTKTNIFMTPHIASLTIPSSAAKRIAETIRIIESGGSPAHEIDLIKGY